jgi:hypothetical protein
MKYPYKQHGGIYIMTNTKTAVATDLDHLKVGDVVDISGFEGAPEPTGTVLSVQTALDAVNQNRVDFITMVLTETDPEDQTVTVKGGNDVVTIPVKVLKEAYVLGY